MFFRLYNYSGIFVWIRSFVRCILNKFRWCRTLAKPFFHQFSIGACRLRSLFFFSLIDLQLRILRIDGNKINTLNGRAPPPPPPQTEWCDQKTKNKKFRKAQHRKECVVFCCVSVYLCVIYLRNWNAMMVFLCVRGETMAAVTKWIENMIQRNGKIA